jgi:hypothetical protein
MPITYVSGDPLLTRAQTLAFGHNAKGRSELGTLETVLLNHYPPAFATYGKNCRSGRVKPGTFWTWRESKPFLMFLVVRETSVGATRLRFVEGAIMMLARDYRLHNLTSVAIAPLANELEWKALKPVVDYWLRACPLPVTIYERYQKGVAAEDDEKTKNFNRRDAEDTEKNE